jgi:hypothetical protein
MNYAAFQIAGRDEAFQKPASRSADAHIRGAISQARELADVCIRAPT